MEDEQINQILSSVKAPLNHPLFFPRVFALVAKNIPRTVDSKDVLFSVLREEYDELSRHLDRSEIQESTSARNILRSRQLANLLITEKGEINLHLIPKAIEIFEQHLYSLGPNRQYDAKRNEHILKVLKILNENKEMVRLLKKIARPYANKYAEDLIRETLLLPYNTSITDAHAKKAVLSAWLCYLRQNVGSCFATAPAEVVHDEQPELFFQDLTDLLATGRLKRTFGGVEYTVPISPSWGNGDLKKPLFIQVSSTGTTPEVWHSPGLVAAFEATGLFPQGGSIKQKMYQLRDWLEPIFKNRSHYQNVFIITAEEMIRIIMLQIYGLTEQNLRDYESRPRSMVQGHLMFQTPQPTKQPSGGGIGEKCAHFLYQFEVAKHAFKGITDNALLKAWEFTLASFSETKLEFTTWNLYASLGMGSNEPEGIGQCIYKLIQSKLEILNRRVQDLQYEAEAVYTQVQVLDSRIRMASNEKELQWIKPEYQSRTHELYTIQETRDEAQQQAKNLVNLYESLYNLYLELFKDYFQEVYDADMQEVQTGPFDDTPAGFRLIYKHGRSNTSLWTRIKNPAEFIDALVSFFSATEPQIASLLEEKKLEKDLSEVVTAIITHVKTKEFLESAFYRMAVAHKTAPIKDPLDHLDQIEKKPWAYTSGGTMNTLTTCYFRLEDKPTEVAKWVESETELLVFLADTLKHTPQKFMLPYNEGNRSSLLMQSPTHAFLLKPNLSPFKECWSNEEFTYTYIRDRLIKPTETFVESILLNDEMLRFIVQDLSEKVPENFLPRFKSVFNSLSGPLSPFFFREYMVDMMEHDRGLNVRGRPILSSDAIDSYLYASLPLLPIYDLADRVHKIMILLPGIDAEKVDDILALLDQITLNRSAGFVTAQQLQNICKALLCLKFLRTSSPYDYHYLISAAAQKLGYAMPTPIIFADTNWVRDEFGFVVNPGTGRLELWRIDYTGSIGAPMSDWKQWVNGTRPDLKWGVYVKPPEYGQN